MGEGVGTKEKERGWVRRKPNNALNIAASDEMEFYKWWLTLIHPFVDLTPREVDVVSAFLKQRMELSKQVPQELVDTLLMSNDIQKKVIEDCHIAQSHFYVLKGNLKKKGVITEKGIEPKLIPNVREDDNGVFQLLFLIKKKEEKR